MHQRKADHVKTSVGEDEIKQGLRGDEQRQFEAICKAIDCYADPLASFIRENHPTLDDHEVATAVEHVFKELAVMAKRGGVKEGGSLKSLLFRMARFNGIDEARKRSKYLHRFVTTQLLREGHGDDPSDELSDDDVLSIVAAKLSEAPGIAAAWRVVTQEWTPAKESAAIQITREFKIWIGTLPRLQRKVAQSMANHFGDITDEEICDEIARTGKRPPLGSVKSARREIREKFTSLIESKERIKTP